MRYRLIILVLLVLSIGNTFAQQQGSQQETQQFVVVPSEQVLLTAASQPECPLQFENAKYIYGADKQGLGVIFELRNRSSKPLRIKSFVYATETTTGGGWSSGARVGADKLIAPGQTVPIEQDDHVEIVPLTDKLRDKLKLQGPMKGVIVLMIKSIEFADGSTYNDESTLKALQVYFEKLSAKADEH